MLLKATLPQFTVVCPPPAPISSPSAPRAHAGGQKFFPSFNTFSAAVVATTRIRKTGIAAIITEYDNRTVRLESRTQRSLRLRRITIFEALIILQPSRGRSASAFRRSVQAAGIVSPPSSPNRRPPHSCQAYERFVAENGERQSTDARTWLRLPKAAQEMIRQSYKSGIQQARPAFHGRALPF